MARHFLTYATIITDKSVECKYLTLKYVEFVQIAIAFCRRFCYNLGMNTEKLTKENQQNIAVTSAIHAQAKELAQRDSLKMYQVVAEGLRLYEAIHQTTNGAAEPQP